MDTRYHSLFTRWTPKEFIAVPVGNTLLDSTSTMRAVIARERDLAWVVFCAQVCLRITHSPEVIALDGDAAEPDTYLGPLYAVDEPRYYVGREGDDLNFLTEQEILEERRLRPHMERWLRPFVSNGSYVHPVQEIFAHLLGEGAVATRSA